MENKKEKRLFEKYRHIAVTGTGAGVGTSFVATTLAYYFAEMGLEVSLTECGVPAEKRRFLNDVMEIPLKGRKNQSLGCGNFLDFYEIVYDEIPLSGKHNFYPVKNYKSVNGASKTKGKGDGNVNRVEPTGGAGKIDFRIITKESKSKDIILDKSDIFRLLASARGDICIYDVSPDMELNFALMDVDILLIVCDSMPSMLYSDRRRISELEQISRKLRDQGGIAKWIINRFGAGASKGKIREFFREKDLNYLNEVPRELISGNEFRNELFAENVEISTVMRDFYDGLRL